jgi:hypothetical protein
VKHFFTPPSPLGFICPTGSTFCQIDTVLQQSVSRFKIEDRFISNRMDISGLLDLYKTTMDRHDELKALLQDPDTAGKPLRKALSEFFFSFQGIKDCSNHTAAAATMIHAAAASQGFDLNIRQTLIASMRISMSPEEKEDTTSLVTTARTSS